MKTLQVDVNEQIVYSLNIMTCVRDFDKSANTVESLENVAFDASDVDCPSQTTSATFWILRGVQKVSGQFEFYLKKQ